MEQHIKDQLEKNPRAKRVFDEVLRRLENKQGSYIISSSETQVEVSPPRMLRDHRERLLAQVTAMGNVYEKSEVPFYVHQAINWATEEWKRNV